MGGTIWVDPDITFSHVGRYRWVNNVGQAVGAELNLLDQMNAEKAANDAEPTAANDETPKQEVA